MAADTSRIRIKVLGPPGVFRGEERIRFPYRKTEGILYYLSVKKSAFRDELINLFWDDCDEQTGRKNLRQALYELRKALPEELVKAEGQNRLFLDPEVPCSLDWDLPDDIILFDGGEFLQYFYIKGAPGFEEWVEECRINQRKRCREAARREISRTIRTRDVKELHEAISAWQKQEPYEEEVIRIAMEAYANCGRYTMAIQAYQDYQALIARELDEEPGEELVHLYQRVFRLKENEAAQSGAAASRFYNRYQEINQISQILDRFAAGGEGKSIVILGDPGVGKSALLEYLSKSPPRNRIRYDITHCYETEKEFSLKAFREWFLWLQKDVQEGILQVSAEHKKMLLSPLDMHSEKDAVPQSLGPSGYTIWEARMISAFREMVNTNRIVLFIDDIQWMDDMSRQLLQRLMLETEPRQFCFVATYRSTEEGQNIDFLHRMQRKGRLEFLTLPAFTEEETQEILRSELPAGSSVILPGEIYKRTDGNALFLMDLIDMIREEGWDAAAIPQQSEYVIQARLRGLSPIQRQILNALSIYMEYAELYELEILVKADRLTICEELENLQKHRLVRERVVGEFIGYEFHHAFYKDYVYSSQPLAKRRHMHHMVAEVYETLRGKERWLEHLPFLIYQYEKSGEREKAEGYRRDYERLMSDL